MPIALRRFLACILVVLLPFQAMAAGIGACDMPMNDCSEQMMQMMDCCDQGDGECAPFNCASPAASSVPAFVPAVFALKQSPAAAASVPSLHESHIPDGLQRPPCPHA